MYFSCLWAHLCVHDTCVFLCDYTCWDQSRTLHFFSSITVHHLALKQGFSVNLKLLFSKTSRSTCMCGFIKHFIICELRWFVLRCLSYVNPNFKFLIFLCFPSKSCGIQKSRKESVEEGCIKVEGFYGRKMRKNK